MVVANFENSIDGEKLLRLLGARPDCEPSPAAMRRVDGLAEDLTDLTDPKLVYRIFDVASTDRSGIELETGTRFSSRKIARALAGAERVCCFVGTIGDALEEKVDRCMAKDRYADAYVLDAMGSLAAEDVVDQFHRRMSEQLEKDGRCTTLRFSPGYCDWPLEEQRPLFDLFEDTARLEVSLTGRCLMAPQKSVSGLFGILPEGVESDAVDANPCNRCGKKDCIARRTGPASH